MDRITDAARPRLPWEAGAPAPVFSIADLPPNIFSIVMATGIVSIVALGSGWGLMAAVMFGLNLAAYVVLGVCAFIRWYHFRARVLADYATHAKAPGLWLIPQLSSCQCWRSCFRFSKE